MSSGSEGTDSTGQTDVPVGEKAPRESRAESVARGYSRRGGGSTQRESGESARRTEASTPYTERSLHWPGSVCKRPSDSQAEVIESQVGESSRLSLVPLSLAIS